MLAQVSLAELGPGLLCFLLTVGIVGGLLLGALTLRAACWICRVEEPSMRRAAAAVFLSSLLVVTVGFVVRFLVSASVSGAGRSSGDRETTVTIVSALINFPAALLISAAIYVAWLENVSFGKGILIWLVQTGLSVLIGLLVGAIVFGMMFLTDLL